MQDARPRRWRRIVLIVLASLLGLYAILGFFVAPGFIRRELVKQASATLHRAVTVRGVKLNPFALSLTVDSLRVADKDNSTLLAWEEFYVNFQLRSLFKGEIIFAEVKLVGPYGRLLLRPDGTMNISDILDSLKAGPKPAKPKPPPVITIDALQIDSARFELVDSSARRPFATTIGPWRIDLKQFSTRSDNQGQYSFAGRTSGGGAFSWKGTIALDPLRTAGEFSLDSLRLSRAGPYYEHTVGFDVADGLGSLRGKYTVDFTPKKEILRLAEGAFRVDRLALVIRGQPDSVIQLRRLEISGIDVNVPEHDVRVGSVALQGGRVNVIRGAHGALNLSKMGAADTQPQSAKAAPATPALAWRWAVGRVAADSFAVNVTDSAAGRPAHFAITGLSVQVDTVASDSATKSRIRAAFTWQGTGTFSAQGAVSIWHKRGDLALTASKMALGPFDAYLAPKVRLLINDGALSAKAKLHIDVADSSKPDIIFTGDVSVDKLATTDAVAKVPFVSFASLSVKGIDYSQRKSQLGIAAIALDAPDIEVAVLENGKPNTSLIFPVDSSAHDTTAPPPAKRDSAKHAAPAMHLSIGGVHVTNGRVGVADRSIKPPVALSITKIDVTTGKLSTDSIGGGTLEMTAAVNEAPLKVSGRFNPLSEKEGQHMTIGLQQMDMIPLSPYFGKHVGNGVKAGKLTVAIKYGIVARKLDSKTKLTLKDFEWGEATNSPDATKLPVKTAFKVLRDRSGRIVFDVQVQGDLDDPTFRLDQVVVKQFKDLILRIATSPFALLGIGGGGGGEDLTFVEFAAGAETLSPDGKKKLDVLAKELFDHPDLKMQIVGSVDSTADKGAGDLQKLATARAKACHDYLLSRPSEKLEPGRVAIAAGTMKTDGAKAIFLPQ